MWQQNADERRLARYETNSEVKICVHPHFYNLFFIFRSSRNIFSQLFPPRFKPHLHLSPDTSNRDTPAPEQRNFSFHSVPMKLSPNPGRESLPHGVYIPIPPAIYIHRAGHIYPPCSPYMPTKSDIYA